VEDQQAISDKKAQLIYNALEAFPEVYSIVPNKAVRSRVNICFRVTKGGDVDAAEKAFLEEGTAQGLTGLKGHRSVGGMTLPERFMNLLTVVSCLISSWTSSTNLGVSHRNPSKQLQFDSP
jgi:hypothetical protein